MKFYMSIFVTLALSVSFSVNAEVLTSSRTDFMEDKTVEWSNVSNQEVVEASRQWLERIESEYSKIYIRQLFDYLLTDKIRTREVTGIPDMEVLESELAFMWNEAKNLVDLRVGVSGGLFNPQYVEDYVFHPLFKGSSAVSSIPVIGSAAIDVIVAQLYKDLLPESIGPNLARGGEYLQDVGSVYVFTQLFSIALNSKTTSGIKSVASVGAYLASGSSVPTLFSTPVTYIN